MPHFFEKRDPWGHGLALWVLVGMVFLLPVALWQLTRVRLQNDVDKWLANDNAQTRQFNWYEQHFHVDDAFILTWEGSQIEDPRVEELARGLVGTADAEGIRRGGLKQIKAVRTPGSIMERMLRSDISRDEALHRVEGVLVGPGNLRVKLTSFGEEHKEKVIKLLAQGAAGQFGLIVDVLPSVSELVDNVATSREEARAAAAASESVAETSDGEAESITTPEPDPALEHHLQIAWTGMHAGRGNVNEFMDWAKSLKLPAIGGDPDGEPVVAECFLYPGGPAALAVSLSEAGMADLAGTFAAVRQVAQNVGIEPGQLRMGGSPVATCELNREVLDAVWNPAQPWYKFHLRSVIALSGLVGVVLAFWLLRSVRLAIIVLAVAYYTTIVSIALIPATGGTMNMVLVVMPTLLLVITISGAVHLANYWKHAAQTNPGTAIVRAIEAARKPCLLAGITTAIGLASLMTSNLTPVRDFGLYASVGTLLSLVAVLYCLPALMQAWPGTPAPETEIDRQAWLTFGRQLVKHSTAVGLVCVVGSVVASYGLRWFRTETKVIRYFHHNARVVRDYKYLEENLAGIVPVETVIRFGKTAQEELPFLERMELVRAIQTKMRALPDISGSISLADFQPIAAPLGETASFREKLQRNARSKAAEDRFKRAEEARNLLVVASGDSEFHEAGDELWRITSQVAIMSQLNYADLTASLDDICQSVIKYHPGTRHVVTGMVPLFLATQQAVLDSLILSFFLAFVVIGGVMMVLLKHPVAGMLSMAPNLLPVTVVFGLISWGGLAVDIGTMITASVALGIAIDGTLHMLTWFQRAIAEGATREDAVVAAIGHCGPAMWQTSAMVAAGLLVLYPAELLLISRFGWLMASLVGAALLGDVLVLPVLLAGPLGKLIQTIHARTAQPPAAVAVDTPEVAAVAPAESVLEMPLAHVHPPTAVPAAHGRPRRVDARGRNDLH